MKRRHLMPMTLSGEIWSYTVLLPEFAVFVADVAGACERRQYLGVTRQKLRTTMRLTIVRWGSPIASFISPFVR